MTAECSQIGIKMFEYMKWVVFGSVCFTLGRISMREKSMDSAILRELKLVTEIPIDEDRTTNRNIRNSSKIINNAINDSNSNNSNNKGYHRQDWNQNSNVTTHNLQNNDMKELKELSPPLLSDILKESKSDKYYTHRYYHYYDEWFLRFRDTNLTFLEIGVLDGASMRTWKQYFRYHYRIYGLGFGIKPMVQYEFSTGSARVLVGDQGLNSTMKMMWDLGPYDIIIDDGSHYPQHMIFSFFSLWNAIKPGGLYIIEDLETNYWGEGMGIYGYILNGTGWGRNSPETNAVDKLKQFIDILPRNQLMRKRISIMPGDKTICSMEWGKNLIKIRKCTDAEQSAQPMKAPTMKRNFTSETYEEWMKEAKRSNPATFHDA